YELGPSSSNITSAGTGPLTGTWSPWFMDRPPFSEHHQTGLWRNATRSGVNHGVGGSGRLFGRGRVACRVLGADDDSASHRGHLQQSAFHHLRSTERSVASRAAAHPATSAQRPPVARDAPAGSPRGCGGARGLLRGGMAGSVHATQVV